MRGFCKCQVAEYVSLVLLRTSDTKTHPSSFWTENYIRTSHHFKLESLLEKIFRFQLLVFSGVWVYLSQCVATEDPKAPLQMPWVQDVMADKVVVGCWACGKQGVQVSGFDDVIRWTNTDLQKWNLDGHPSHLESLLRNYVGMYQSSGLSIFNEDGESYCHCSYLETRMAPRHFSRALN